MGTYGPSSSSSSISGAKGVLGFERARLRDTDGELARPCKSSLSSESAVDERTGLADGLGFMAEDLLRGVFGVAMGLVGVDVAERFALSGLPVARMLFRRWDTALAVQSLWTGC
jgi:hypothetical protein